MKYDVAIIGSGLGGLVCANILSQAGMSVLVLEREAQPGGCMQSYRRAGMAIDTGLHYVGGLGQGQSLHTVFSRLGLLSLPWQHLDADGFDHVTIGGRTFRLAEGFERFADTLAQDFPHERAALKKYAMVLQDATKSHLSHLSKEQAMGVLLERASAGAWNYLCETFSDPLLISVLSGNLLKMELRKDTLPLFAFAHTGGSYVESSWRLRGHGGTLVDRLVARLQQHGGVLLTGKEAASLTGDEGGITALHTTDNDTFEARYFISDVHPAQTCQLAKQLKPVYRRRICSLANTTGMLTASLIVKAGQLSYFNHNHFVYRDASVWEPPQPTAHGQTPVDRVMVSCRVPEDGSAFTRQIDLLTPMSWAECLPWAHTTHGRRGQDYKDMKARKARQCIALAGQVLPGLAGMVEHCYVSTPLTWRDYTLTPEGSAYGLRKDYSHPLFTMLSARTPAANLLLTGQSLMLHGVHGVTLTALHTCAELLGHDYIKTHYEATT